MGVAFIYSSNQHLLSTYCMLKQGQGRDGLSSDVRAVGAGGRGPLWEGLLPAPPGVLDTLVSTLLGDVPRWKRNRCPRPSSRKSPRPRGGVCVLAATLRRPAGRGPRSSALHSRVTRLSAACPALWAAAPGCFVGSLPSGVPLWDDMVKVTSWLGGCRSQL